MKKNNILIFAMLMLAAHHSNGQVLFTYGKHPVTVAAFKQSFEKNNPETSATVHLTSDSRHKTRRARFLELRILCSLDPTSAWVYEVWA